MTRMMEVVNDESGDDRRQQAAAARLGEMLETEYPELQEDELNAFLADAAEKSARDQRDAEDDPKFADPRVEGGRAIFGYEPDTRQLGNVALAATVQSQGFIPAGTRFPGDRTQRFLPGGRWQRRRGSAYPPINGVY